VPLKSRTSNVQKEMAQEESTAHGRVVKRNICFSYLQFFFYHLFFSVV